MNVPIINRQNEIIVDYINNSGLFYSSTLISFCCGDGKDIQFFSKKIDINKYVGVDISKEAINIAQKRNIHNVVFVHKDLFDFKSLEKFDYVLCLSALEHFEDDKKVLKHISKFMGDKRTARLIISVPAHSKKYSRQDMAIGHYRRYDVEDIEELVRETNLKIIKLYSIGYPVATIYTWFYNKYLSLKNVIFDIEATKVSGIEKHNKNIVMKIGNKFLFRILTFLIRLDKFYLNTTLGTHYIVVLANGE